MQNANILNLLFGLVLVATLKILLCNEYEIFILLLNLSY